MKKPYSYLFLLAFSTISLCQIEDNDSVSKKVTIEGVLKMYLINWFGGSVEINDYYETFYEGEYIAFVVETDEEINVIPYLDRENKNNLLSIVDESEISEIKYSNFMIVPNFTMMKKISSNYLSINVFVQQALFMFL